MAKLEVEARVESRGTSLNVIARELRNMDDRQVALIFKRRLEEAAKPFPLRVRQAVYAIPVKEHPEHPWQRAHSGLRARIAQCVTLTSWDDDHTFGHRSAGVSVWVDVRKMEPDYKSLPLYMEGVYEGRLHNYTRWRHPVYGPSARNPEPGYAQQPPHPYFRQVVEPLGRAAREAMDVALDDITRQISGR